MYREDNAKAEQWGVGIAFLLMVGFLIALPLCIFFPWLIVPIVIGIIWVIKRLLKNK